MRSSILTRLGLSLVLLALMGGSCGMLFLHHDFLALLGVLAMLALGTIMNYYYSTKPVSTAVGMLARQFEAAGFEPLSEAQQQCASDLLARTRTFRDSPVEILQAVGARYRDGGIVWVQYITQRHMQPGFAWLIGFADPFVAHGRLVPSLRTEALNITDLFNPDTEVLGELLGRMPMSTQQAFESNSCFLYEFQDRILMADFYASGATFAAARQNYFGHGVLSMLHLAETVASTPGLFFTADLRARRGALGVKPG
ncbi:MAG: hypothetical protein GX591_18025 [Planctomycetes bacterium]|nr:hypothetical protein [Planctomycetota bacterium]